MDLIDECALLGAAILSAQKLEFTLYGIVAHLSHLPEAQKEKRFRDLTPERFLRGNIEDLRASCKTRNLKFSAPRQPLQASDF